MINHARAIKILFFAFQAGLPLFYLTGYMTNTNPRKPYTIHETTLQMPVTICAILAGLLAIFWFMFRMKAFLPNGKFQSEMILGLAFSEAVSIFGMLLFFLTHNLAGLPPFIVASLLINFIFCAPKVLTR